MEGVTKALERVLKKTIEERRKGWDIKMIILRRFAPLLCSNPKRF